MSGFINKVLSKHSHAHSLPYCLGWLLHDHSRLEQLPLCGPRSQKLQTDTLEKKVCDSRANSTRPWARPCLSGKKARFGWARGGTILRLFFPALTNVKSFSSSSSAAWFWKYSNPHRILTEH